MIVQLVVSPHSSLTTCMCGCMDGWQPRQVRSGGETER